jgi:hypothetical protein
MNAAEQDLRGEICLAILAFLAFAEFHGGAAPLLDGTIDRWLCAGKPADPQIARALRNTRRVLNHYIASGGRIPAWVPASLLAALKEPSSAYMTDALPPGSPSGNTQPSAIASGQSRPMSPRECNNTKGI